MSSNKNAMTIRLPYEEYKFLSTLGYEQSLTVGMLARQILREYIETKRKELKLPSFEITKSMEEFIMKDENPVINDDARGNKDEDGVPTDIFEEEVLVFTEEPYIGELDSASFKDR